MRHCATEFRKIAMFVCKPWDSIVEINTTIIKTLQDQLKRKLHLEISKGISDQTLW